MIRGITIFILWGILSCTSGEDYVNKFSDQEFVRIADFQDRRLSDSLYQFFRHKNPAYRRDAVLAFGSIQDTIAVDQIGSLLNDGDVEVRKAAAFALGQVGGQKAFNILLTAKVDSLTMLEILEATGKAVSKQSAIPAEINSWGLYRAAQQGHADTTLIRKAINYLSPLYDENVRLGAAHFFARGPQDISAAEAILIETSRESSSVFVRMTTTLALRKIKTNQSLKALRDVLKTDPDYRVQVNAIRALQVFNIAETKESLVTSLGDPDVNVRVAASEAIKAVATKSEYKELVPLARSSTSWRVQGNLYEAILSTSNNKEISEEVIKLYSTLDNAYAKAALIAALGKSPIAYNFIGDQLNNSTIPVIRSAAAAALVSINHHKEFDAVLRTKFIGVYRKALETGDAAVIGTVASALADTSLRYKEVITDYSFLHEAKSKLALPKDNEALQTLESAINYFEGKIVTEGVRNEFNHPIDWALVKTIPRDQRVRIETVKGNIIIRLLVEEAPGSVANFVKSVNEGYFNAKNFHRVVPNFVIQGGCNRGDGWGSEDYSIRSEFSMRKYTEGSVGMASAGKDTEGTQWFITHSPTPHLDGRYTIFAIVEEGMGVVHNMEVGDAIMMVELLI